MKSEGYCYAYGYTDAMLGTIKHIAEVKGVSGQLKLKRILEEIESGRKDLSMKLETEYEKKPDEPKTEELNMLSSGVGASCLNSGDDS